MQSRRDFLRAAAATGLVAATRPWHLIDAYADVAAAPPFEHVVVVMMENRSFDHFLGWLPGAVGRQAGLAYTDAKGDTYPTYDLKDDHQGCGYTDPDHSFTGFISEYNRGRLDGFLRAGKGGGPGDTFPIGYYTEPTVATLGGLARSYTLSDNYFCSIMAETYPNRFYMHSGATDREVNGSQTCSLKTIWDSLSTAGLTGGYYFTDLPFLALYPAGKYGSIMKDVSQFMVDAAAGTLPNVSFVDPALNAEGEGLSRDDHPHADVTAGEYFLSQVYSAVRSSPLWSKTVMVITYDEWGGFYDHVLPPHAMDSTVFTGPGPHADPTQLGFRVPNVVISPFSPPGRIVQGGQPFDHTSILRMIEWRWNLPPLTTRTAHARNLADMLDFRLARTDTPAIPSSPTLGAGACGPASRAATPPAPLAGVTGGPNGQPMPTSSPSPSPSAPSGAAGANAAAAGLANTAGGTPGAVPAAAATALLAGAYLGVRRRRLIGGAGAGEGLSSEELIETV